MATVFLAQDLKHRRPVALKVLHPHLAATLGVERFAREIDIAAHLTHPHIVPLHDSGAADGLLFYVMPFIDGPALRERLAREGRLPVGDAVQLAAEVADALDYAHACGVVHRDIKPENILLARGHAMVADFGIARALSEAAGANLTSTGALLGTPAYMSPEQVEGGRVDGRTDQYALACVAYEMLSGKPPFSGTTPQAVLVRHLQQGPPSLRVVRPPLPGHVIRAVEIALAKSPADRFLTAGAFRAAITGTGSTRRRRLSPSWRAWPRVGLLAAIVGIIAFTALWWRALAASRFQARDWILVADFDGPTDDPNLADAVRELTTTALNQSSYVSTLPREQLNNILRSAGKPDTTRVTPEIARELGYRSSIRGVLVGSVTRLGRSSYSIVLHVIDAEEGTDIVSVAGAASDSTFVATVQRLAGEVRVGLGERRGAIQADLTLDQTATPSFDAFRRYTAGLKLLRKGDGQGSNRVLREALALDTGFASAWYLIAWNYLNDRMLDSARIAFAEALRRPDRLGVPRRYRVEADAAYALRYDLNGAVRASDLYLEHFSRSFSALNNRGLVLAALGRYDDALRDFEQAIAVHPFGRRQAQIEVMNRAETLVALGRVEDVRATIADLTGSFATYVRILVAAATDDWVDADTVGSAAAEAPSSAGFLRVQAVATSAAGSAAQGELAAADRRLADAARSAPPDAARWYGRARLLLAEAGERPVPPLPAAAATDTSGPGLITYGLWAVQLGDTAGARRRQRRVAQLLVGERTTLGFGPALLEARLAARAQRWADVIRLIGPAASRGEHDSVLLDRVNSLELRWPVAEAYAQLGKIDSAIAMIDLTLRPSLMPGNAVAWRGLVFPFAHRRLALFNQRRGAKDEARRHWRVFVATLTHPDPELRSMVFEANRALQLSQSEQ